MKLLALLLSFVLSSDQAPKPADPPDIAIFRRQAKLIDQMADLYPGVEVTVRWMPCGEVNSFYFPDLHAIVLCTETASVGDAALGIAAHEMGHAVAEQLAGMDGESDADEVAELSMVRLGYRDELLATAMFFAGQSVTAHVRGDPHPGNGYRGWEMACVEAGSEDGPMECQVLYVGLTIRWEHLLHQRQIDLDKKETN